MRLDIPERVEKIMDMVSSRGYESYLVGGCIRDILLRHQPRDWDIATDAPIPKLMELFNGAGVRVIPVGAGKGTIRVVLEGEVFEITTFRHGEGISGERPLEEDLSLRDFTINAMAYHRQLGFIDPFHGMEDIRKGRIAAVGDGEKRFQEDPLRIIRGVRLAGELNFTIHPRTKDSMYKMRKELKRVSIERIRDELSKILLQDRPSASLRLLKDLELLDYIIPELNACVDFDQRSPYHDRDVFEHTLLVVDGTPREITVRLAALLHDIAKPRCFTVDQEGVGHFYSHNQVGAEMAQKILQRLRYSNRIIKNVSILVKEHMYQMEHIQPKAVKRLMNRLGEENLEAFFQLKRADLLGTKAPQDVWKLENLRRVCMEILNRPRLMTVKDLAINGHDLLGLGIPQGKEIGEMLEYLLEHVLDHPDLNEREILIDLAKQKWVQGRA